jgi:hypothetical protein
MLLDAHVMDMIVLVVDRESQRHGQVGKMLYHDWREFGGIGVEFADGRQEEFYDGIIKGDPPSKIKWFYRRVDDKANEFDAKSIGPASFQREFVEHGGKLEEAAKEYRTLFGEELPNLPR